MYKTCTMKRVLSTILAVMCVLAVATFTASAYSNGTYTVNTSAGVNVRTGPGSGYARVGAASPNISFTVSRTSGSWGYTSSIRCTNGNQSGWVCLDYCRYSGCGSPRSSYNDVFASVRGSGYQLSQARSYEAGSFSKGTFVYVWGYLHDVDGNLYKSYGSGTCNMTLSIYRPNGSCAFTYTYNDCDCNWIGQTLDTVGTWKIQSKITGSLSGTNTRTITVKDTSASVSPTGIRLNTSSVSISKGSSYTLTATVYPSNAGNKSVSWSSSNSGVVSVSKGRITANQPGTATITAKTINGYTATCSVTVKGVYIDCSASDTLLTVGDVVYYKAKSVPGASSYTWSSSDTGVVSVSSSGTVTAKKAGTATITVRASTGYSASVSVRVSAKETWKTGNFDQGYVAKGYTRVCLNKNRGTAYIKVFSYDMTGRKTSGKMHVTLRDYNGAWIWEGDVDSGSSLKLGADHSEYRVYVAKKQYPNTLIGNAQDFENVGKCVYWAINCTSNCFVR